MTARAAVHGLLSSDPELQELGFTVYGSNAADTVDEKRFLIVSWQPGSAAFGKHGSEAVLVWAHDKDRDYTAVDAALSRVRDLLHDATHIVGEDGRTLTTARWNGVSDDLYDDGYGTVTKNADFTVVSR
jgi:hypothetical protein